MASGSSTPLTSTLTTDQNTLYLPLEAIDDEEFAAIRLRGMLNTWPTMVYDNGNYPTRGMSFWPIPSQPNFVELWLWEPLNVYVDLDEELNLPQGYERYLRYALAIEIAPEFGKEVPQVLSGVLMEAETNLKRMNQVTPISLASVSLNTISNRNRGWNYLTMITGGDVLPKVGQQ